MASQALIGGYAGGRRGRSGVTRRVYHWGARSTFTSGVIRGDADVIGGVFSQREAIQVITRGFAHIDGLGAVGWGGAVIYLVSVDCTTTGIPYKRRGLCQWRDQHGQEKDQRTDCDESTVSLHDALTNQDISCLLIVKYAYCQVVANKVPLQQETLKEIDG